MFRAPAIARAGALGLAALTFAYRYVTVGALENDHFVHLARAHQVLLHGAWPVRDFVDPGMPLQYLASALAAWLLGPSLLSDVVLNAALLAAAAGVTFALAHKATGSLPIAAVAGALEVAARPRLYNAPKLFVLVVAIAIAWRYADRPTRRRLAGLAAWTAAAFMVRHDYAVYVGIAAVLLIATADRTRPALTLATYAGFTFACVLPWLIYVQWAEGLGPYISSAVAFSRAEAARTAGQWPGPMFWLLLAVPIATMVIARRRAVLRVSPAHVTFACVLLLCVEVAFLRDILSTRLPDIAGAAAVVFACLLGLVLPSHKRSMTVLGGAIALVIVVSLAPRARASLTLAAVVRQPVVVTERLTTWPWTPIVPFPDIVPLALYVNRCTLPGDRVLVGWFAPEFAVIARRPFAGGHPSWLPGYYDSDAEQDRTIARLGREHTPVLLLDDGFASAWPRVNKYLMSRPYRRAREVLVQGRPVDVWIDVTNGPFRVDPELALPCFEVYPEHASTGSAGYLAKRSSAYDSVHR